MATVVCRQPRDEGGRAPAMQLLLYPSSTTSRPGPRATLFAAGFLLTAHDMDWFRDHYLRDPETIAQPDVSPFQAEDLERPRPRLRRHRRLRRAARRGRGLRSQDARGRHDGGARRHPGLVHGFGQMTQVSRASRAAMFEVAGAMRMGLACSYSYWSASSTSSREARRAGAIAATTPAIAAKTSSRTRVPIG